MQEPDPGTNFGVAITSGGELLTWGSGSTTLLVPPEGDDYTAVVAGEMHCIALHADGTLEAWGGDGMDQTDIPDGDEFEVLGTGMRFSMAIDATERLWAWGRDDEAQVTDLPGGAEWLAVAGGWGHGVAIQRSDCDGNGVDDALELATINGSHAKEKVSASVPERLRLPGALLEVADLPHRAGQPIAKHHLVKKCVVGTRCALPSVA